MSQMNGSQDMLQRLARVETKQDMMGDTREIAREAQQTAMAAHKRLDSLEDQHKWLWRTVVGAFVIGCVNLLFKWKGM